MVFPTRRGQIIARRVRIGARPERFLHRESGPPSLRRLKRLVLRALPPQLTVACVQLKPRLPPLWRNFPQCDSLLRSSLTLFVVTLIWRRVMHGRSGRLVGLEKGTGSSQFSRSTWSPSLSAISSYLPVSFRSIAAADNLAEKARATHFPSGLRSLVMSASWALRAQRQSTGATSAAAAGYDEPATAHNGAVAGLAASEPCYEEPVLPLPAQRRAVVAGTSARDGLLGNEGGRGIRLWL